MSRCEGTPISWLRLERLALGEPDDGDARSHLESCDACRAALESIESDRRQLRPLRLEAIRPRRWWQSWAFAGTGLVAAVAALLVVFAGGGGDSRSADTVGIKGGGELVISLVRERGGQVADNADRFVDGDRFKVAITCSEPGDVTLEISVDQGGARYHPLGRETEIYCSNRTLVAGAFAPTGEQVVRVCARPEPGDASACIELRPASE